MAHYGFLLREHLTLRCRSCAQAEAVPTPKASSIAHGARLPLHDIDLWWLERDLQLLFTYARPFHSLFETEAIPVWIGLGSFLVARVLPRDRNRKADYPRDEIPVPTDRRPATRSVERLVHSRLAPGTRRE